MLLVEGVVLVAEVVEVVVEEKKGKMEDLLAILHVVVLMGIVVKEIPVLQDGGKAGKGVEEL